MVSKPYRGKSLRNLPTRGRGTCPTCHATRIKILYNLVLNDGSKAIVCKRCRKAS